MTSQTIAAIAAIILTGLTSLESDTARHGAPAARSPVETNWGSVAPSLVRINPSSPGDRASDTRPDPSGPLDTSRPIDL